MTNFLAKLDPSGKPLWVTPLNGVFRPSGGIWVLGLAVDSANNIYLTDSFTGASVSLGGGVVSSKGGRDGFLLKTDPDGKPLWATTFGGTRNEWCYDVAVDSQGLITLAGSFQGTATFGTKVLTSAGDQDAFVARLDSSGTFVWVAQGGGGSAGWPNNWAVHLALDSTGNAYVTGFAKAGAKLGSFTAVADKPFAAKLDGAGSFLWATSLDSHGTVALDPAGDVLVPGSTSGAAISSPTNPTIVKLKGSDGSVLWSQKVASTGTVAAWAEGVSVDSAGWTSFAGGFSGTTTFGSQALTATSSVDGFLALVDPEGNIAVAEQFGCDPLASGADLDLAADSAGNLFVTGGFAGTTSLGSSTVTSNGDSDLFIWKRKTLPKPQDATAKGTMRWYTSGQPIAGVDVCLFLNGKKTTQCTKTDAAGAWSLSVPANVELSILFDQTGMASLAFPLKAGAGSTVDFGGFSNWTAAEASAAFAQVGLTYPPVGTGFIAFNATSGATVKLVPSAGAGPYYTNNKTQIDLSLTAMDKVTGNIGVAFVLALPPGTYDGQVSRPASVCTSTVGWPPTVATLRAPVIDGYGTFVKADCAP